MPVKITYFTDENPNENLSLFDYQEIMERVERTGNVEIIHIKFESVSQEEYDKWVEEEKSRYECENYSGDGTEFFTP